MKAEELTKIVVDALEDMKAREIRVIDVRGKTSVTDVMVIATGTSNRQVKSQSEHVVEKAKEHGVRPLGIEGEKEAEWILVDLGDVVVHIMQPEIRDFYHLEKLWATDEIAGGEVVSRDRGA
ncbi:MAG: ribosome silencing factor [Gammaproteobacteria bacterium]|nr:ribosome silencing factor [Gammaproteobacteria bacterium]